MDSLNLKTEYGWEKEDVSYCHSYLAPKVISLLPEGDALKILDAGCGNGLLTAKLAALGHSVVGIDVAEDGIEIARKNYPDIRFEVHSGYDDFHDIVDQVDVVISTEVVEHLFTPPLYMKSVFNILRPGGALIVTTPYHGFLKNLALSLTNKWDHHHTVAWEGGHIKFFSPATLTAMLSEAGFVNFRFNNAGRVRWLWKSMVIKCTKRD